MLLFQQMRTASVGPCLSQDCDARDAAQGQAKQAQATRSSLTLCISLVTGALGKDTQSPFTGEETEALAEQDRW